MNMRLTRALRSALAALAILLSPGFEAYAQTAPDLRVDVPVLLKQARIVFNMDHLAFSGDTPIGLAHMTLLADRLQQSSVEWKIVGVFHGEAGYMLLDDEKYNAVRKTKTGNPYKALILALIARGVAIEECVNTMKANGWTNADLVAGVKVNGGAELRIIELVQQGYVMLQP